jgi:putative endonuclease
MFHYTYILQSESDGNFYTGCTNDLRKRVQQHQSGQVISTQERLPIKLVYYEACLDQQDAYAREKYLKSGMGKRFIRNRIKRFQSLTGLI